MDTATEHPPTPAEEHKSMTNEAAVPAPIDPEHDIDAKTTVIWLSACLVLVVVMLALGLRTGLLVGLSIPVSFMVGFLILSSISSLRRNPVPGTTKPDP